MILHHCDSEKAAEFGFSIACPKALVIETDFLAGCLGNDPTQGEDAKYFQFDLMGQDLSAYQLTSEEDPSLLPADTELAKQAQMAMQVIENVHSLRGQEWLEKNLNSVLEMLGFERV